MWRKTYYICMYHITVPCSWKATNKQPSIVNLDGGLHHDVLPERIWKGHLTKQKGSKQKKRDVFGNKLGNAWCCSDLKMKVTPERICFGMVKLQRKHQYFVFRVVLNENYHGHNLFMLHLVVMTQHTHGPGPNSRTHCLSKASGIGLWQPNRTDCAGLSGISCALCNKEISCVVSTYTCCVINVP